MNTGHRLVTLATILLLACAALCLGCRAQRACLEDEECFGAEFCHPDGFCALYDGCVPVEAIRDADSGSPYLFDDPDLSTCLPEPADMSAQEEDLGAGEDMGGVSLEER